MVLCTATERVLLPAAVVLPGLVVVQIMGTAYYGQVSQWSKGEYLGAHSACVRGMHCSWYKKGVAALAARVVA
jgi:hypothetical protein